MASARSVLSVNSMSLTLLGLLYVGLVEFMAPGPAHQVAVLVGQRPPLRTS